MNTLFIRGPVYKVSEHHVQRNLRETLTLTPYLNVNDKYYLDCSRPHPRLKNPSYGPGTGINEISAVISTTLCSDQFFFNV